MRLLLVLGLLLCAMPARAADSRPTVAVLYFDYSGNDAEIAVLKKGLAQMLISDLGGMESIRLVERERLEEILAELELAESGKIDRATAAKVGKLLGARYLVLGHYFDFKGALQVNANVVEVETSRILKSASVHGKPDDFLEVEQKLAADLGAILAKELKAEAPSKPRVARPAKLSTRTAILYSKALAQIDGGKKDEAKKTLETVVKEQEDFKLAALDLDKLMQ